MQRTHSRLLLLALFATLANIHAIAQNSVYGIGSQTWGINIPIENGFINVANGEVHLEIPIASLPQRGGLPLNEKLVYDSRIWQIVSTGSGFSFQPTNVPAPYSGMSPTCVGYPPAECSSNPPPGGAVSIQPANIPNSMAGWRFVAGNETGVLHDYLSGNLTDLNALSVYQWGWTDPSGSLHYFPFKTGTGWCPSCSPRTGSGYALDGSGYYMTVTDFNNATVYDQGGNEVYPAVVDRNGNGFSSDSSGNLVDTIGRTPVTVSKSGNEIYYDVLTIGGATKRYTVTTETINVHTAFGQSGVSEYTGPLTAIQSIALPDGSSYAFTYDSGTSSGNFGELQSITLPTGGVVSMEYQNYLDSYQNKNRWLSSYSGGKGSYTFSPSVITQCSGANEVGCKEQMVVTDGNSNWVTYLLTLNNGAWNTQMTYSSGVTTATNYDFTQVVETGCTDTYSLCVGAKWITASSTTTLLENGQQAAQTQYTYLNPWSGKPSTVKQWNYYAGTLTSAPSPQTPTKEIDYTYSPSVNGSLVATDVKQLDSSGTLVAETQYGYDSRGNLNSTTLGIPGLVATVGTSSTYDSFGMKQNDVDGNSYTTSYSYSCSGTYLSTITLPVVVNGKNLQSKTEYDCSSGLVTSTQNPNDVANKVATTYDYFTSGQNLGRLQSVTSPDGGTTTYSYPSATETDQTVTQSTSVNLTSSVVLDSFGRNYQTNSAAPEGNISSETTYDAAGRPNCVTTAHLQGGTSTDGTTCTDYDVLGRATKTTMPDGRFLTSTYSGAIQWTTDELSHSKQFTYDAFHRLVKVMESSAYETDYKYDALDNLVEVDQWGGVNGSTAYGVRKRLFAYDSLGRKRAESIPENQSALVPASLTCAGTAPGTTWTACFSYDSNGNMKSSTDNSGTVLSYDYDALNRVTNESALNGSFTYNYYYDSNSQGQTNSMGRLSYSTNNVNAATLFSYDSMGRPTQEQYWTPQVPNWSTTVSAGYDLAGNMTSLTYPDGRVVGQTFDGANRFTGVNYAKWGATSVGTPYYSVQAFAPPGQPTTATMGNGVSIAASFNSRQNVTSMAYTSSAGILWSKQFTWDKNASNLLLLVDGITGYGRQFTYDSLNRITAAKDTLVNTPGSTKSTGSLTVSGIEQFTFIRSPCDSEVNCGPPKVWDTGTFTLSVGGTTVGSATYQGGSTAASVASALAASINGNPSSPVRARYRCPGSTIALISKYAGASSNYSLSASATYDSDDFAAASFTASFSGPSMTGGSGYLPPGLLNETYAYDPFGNMTQSGNFGFSQSFNEFNQITGYSYDSVGNQNTDISNHVLAFDPNGLLSSVAGGQETYVYDAQGNRVEVNGSTVTDYIYFGGTPIAMLNGGTYTDLIYAGGSLVAEVSGTQNAVPVYHMADNLGSLTSVNYAPYGQTFSGSTSDPFGFAGLQSDATTGLYHADFRQFSPQQGRWQSPDPYSGSYNLADPQSLNRYTYVNGRPMAFTDPSGLFLNGAVDPNYVPWTLGGEVAAIAPPLMAAVGLFEIANKLVDLLNRDHFHGSLEKRLGVGIWNDKFGVPYGGLTNGIQQALGLPTMADVGCNPICDATGAGGYTADGKYCSALSSNCTPEGDFARYLTFLACEAHDTGEQLEDGEEYHKFILPYAAFEAKWAVRFIRLGKNLSNRSLIGMALGAVDLNILAAHANSKCSKEIYGK